LCIFVLAPVVPIIVSNITCSCLILTVHLLASKSEIIFSLIFKVETALGILAFSFDFTNMDFDFVAEVKQVRQRIG
jgi:hypothetical protein